MTTTFKEVINYISMLSSDERALVAHCLISSLESNADEGVDDAWAILAEERFQSLESGNVKGSSWQEIRNTVMG